MSNDSLNAITEENLVEDIAADICDTVSRLNGIAYTPKQWMGTARNALAHFKYHSGKTSEISVKNVFTDEANLKAQISVDRLNQIEVHAEEGHKFGKSTNSVILELIHHIRAIEKVRDEWCMEYVKLRDSKPVMRKQDAAQALSEAILEAHAKWQEQYFGVGHAN